MRAGNKFHPPPPTQSDMADKATHIFSNNNLPTSGIVYSFCKSGFWDLIRS